MAKHQNDQIKEHKLTNYVANQRPPKHNSIKKKKEK